MNDDSSLSKKITEVYKTSQETISAAPLKHKLLLGATATGLIFEWGTGNEALLGMVGGNTLDRTDSSVVTGLMTGAVSFTEQTIFGIAMAANINNYPQILAKVREKVTDREDRPTSSNNFMAAFALGSSAVVLIDNAKTKKTFAQNSGTVLKSSGMIGGGVATIAVTAAGIANYGARHGFENQAEMAVDTVSNPLTYLAIFGLKLAIDKYKKVRADRKETS